jgi:hypothetical protein
VFFHLTEKQIKKEARAIIHDNPEEINLVVLRFTDTEALSKLTWKHPREFLFEGVMYDIMEQGQEGNTVWFKCYRDHKETRFDVEKKKLIANALGKDPFQKQQNEKIKNFFSNLFYQKTSNGNLLFSTPSLMHYALDIKHYALICIIPPSPPPKLVS